MTCPHAAPVDVESELTGIWRIDWVTCSACGKALRMERRLEVHP